MAAPAPIITARTQEALDSWCDVDWNAEGDQPAAIMEGQWSPPPTGWRWRVDLYIGDAAAAGANACKGVFEKEDNAANGSSPSHLFLSAHVALSWPLLPSPLGCIQKWLYPNVDLCIQELVSALSCADQRHH
eukprot:407596-Rhodomonas_salina.1